MSLHTDLDPLKPVSAASGGEEGDENGRLRNPKDWQFFERNPDAATATASFGETFVIDGQLDSEDIGSPFVESTNDSFDFLHVPGSG